MYERMQLMGAVYANRNAIGFFSWRKDRKVHWQNIEQLSAAPQAMATLRPRCRSK